MKYDALRDVLDTPIQVRRNHSKVLLVCAMREEFDSLKTGAEKLGYSVVTEDLANFCRFEMQHCTVFGFFFGISFFNQVTVNDIIRSLNIDEVINFGTCASLVPAEPGDVYVSNKCRCANLYLPQFGYVPGTHRKDEIPEYGPTIVSDNFFLDRRDIAEFIMHRYPDAVSFDMESYMLKAICDQSNNKPFLSMRAVSDGGSNEEFEVNLRKAAEVSAMYAIRFLERTSVGYFLKEHSYSK